MDVTPDSGRRGRRALVTGGAIRVGRSICLALGEAGYRVAVHYRTSHADAAVTVRELKRMGSRPVALKADLSRPEQIDSMFDQIDEHFGGLDLLVNGASGIAVRMATNIPPHNLREVVDATVRLMSDPELTVDDLMQDDDETGRIGVKGPDFPTGAYILGNRGIQDALLTGRGSVKMRAVTDVVEIRGGADLSERFDITSGSPTVEPGMVVVIDRALPYWSTIEMCEVEGSSSDSSSAH